MIRCSDSRGRLIHPHTLLYAQVSKLVPLDDYQKEEAIIICSKTNLGYYIG